MGSGIQVRILSSTGFARAAQNLYLFRTTIKRNPLLTFNEDYLLNIKYEVNLEFGLSFSINSLAI
jgi:hypothetical protein